MVSSKLRCGLFSLCCTLAVVSGAYQAVGEDLRPSQVQPLKNKAFQAAKTTPFEVQGSEPSGDFSGYDKYLAHKYYDVVVYKGSVSQTDWHTIVGLPNTIETASTNHDDLPFENVDLPFDFIFYGHTHRSLYINPNGFLAFDKIECRTHTFCNWSPTYRTDQYYTMYIAPLMTDLNPEAFKNATIHSRVDTAAKTFTVQWTNVPLYQDHQIVGKEDHGQDAHFYTFQVVLFSDGKIKFNYLNLDPVSPDTISLLPYNLPYPLTIGIDDAAIVRMADGAEVRGTYVPVSIQYRQLLSPAGASVPVSVELHPLPTCIQQTSCEDCFTLTKVNSADQENSLQCQWCATSAKCSDGEGQRLGEDLEMQACTNSGSGMVSMDFLQSDPAICQHLGPIITAAREKAAAIAARNESSSSTSNTAVVVSMVILALVIVVVAACLCKRYAGTTRRRGSGPAYAMRVEGNDDDEADATGGEQDQEAMKLTETALAVANTGDDSDVSDV